MSKIKLPQKAIANVNNITNIQPFKIDLQKTLETQEKKLLFSFAIFDRLHPLFNLGNNEFHSEHIDSEWYISFLDKLSEVGKQDISCLKETVSLHPFSLKNSNVKKSDINPQYEYWQFRIDHKSRIIGVKVNNIFYVRWLDPHHNHCDSPGYGKAIYCCKVVSYQEKLIEENEILKQENQKLKEENKEIWETFR